MLLLFFNKHIKNKKKRDDAIFGPIRRSLQSKSKTSKKSFGLHNTASSPP